MKNRRNIVEQQNPPQNPNDIWLKDGKFYHSTSEGWTVIGSGVEYPNKEAMTADNPKGGTIGIDKESGEPSIYNDVTKQWSPLGGGMNITTWQELKDKRDAGKLTPGALYRITDYNCTTTQKNTRSAGHQFDIVLLALSEDKLAEEGWAMMHDGVDMFDDYDIYTFTFSDGVSKEYYIKIIEIPDESDPDNPYLNTRIVDIKTFIGNEVPNEQIGQYGFIIDNINKTATNAYISSAQFEELLTVKYPYNYFQNSNLSAWKVWYCLDNDKSRFAWADDSVDEGEPAFITIIGGKGGIRTFYRYSAGDSNNLFAWNEDGGTPRYTASQTPSAGDTMYYDNGTDSGLTVNSFTPAHKGTGPNGRGVIYRLIDEWNNDVPYDFKNIQFIRKLNGGKLDAQGTDTYCYTFTLYDIGNEEYKDASIFAINYKNDENGTRSCYDNKIETIAAYHTMFDFYNKYSLDLPNIICIAEVETGKRCWNICKNIMKGCTFSVSGDSSFNNIYSKNLEYTDVIGQIILFNKKVVLENI